MGQVERLLAIQDAEQGRMEGELAAAFTSAMERIVERFRVTGDPNPPDELGRDVEAVLRQSWSRVIAQSGEVVAEEFKAVGPLEVKADPSFFERIVQEFIAQYGGLKIRQIVKATQDQMVRLIARGMRDGLGVQGIADMIADAIPEIARLRAHTIARTESHTASMFASQETAKATGRQLMKEWVSVEDHRTRDFGEGDGDVDEYSHRAMSGVQVGMDDVFMVPNKYGGKEALRFPGDPNGSAGNIINCRCAQVYRRIS